MLSTLSSCSYLGVKNDLELFTIPGTQFSHEGGEFIDYYPSQLRPQESDTIDFNIRNNGLMYLDPSSIFLQVRAKLVRADGATTVECKREATKLQIVKGAATTDLPTLQTVEAKLSSGDTAYMCDNIANSLIIVIST